MKTDILIYVLAGSFSTVVHKREKEDILKDAGLKEIPDNYPYDYGIHEKLHGKTKCAANMHKWEAVYILENKDKLLLFIIKTNLPIITKTIKVTYGHEEISLDF